MPHENAMPVRFWPWTWAGSWDYSLPSTVKVTTDETPAQDGLLWFEPDGWPTALTIQAAIRNVGYNWKLYAPGTYYPSATYYVAPAVRTRTLSYALKSPILVGTTYTMPISNAIYGITESGLRIAGGTLSSGAEIPNLGYANNMYLAEPAANHVEQIASGWGTTVTSGNYRTVWSNGTLTLTWGAGLGGGSYTPELPVYAQFSRYPEGAADTAVQGINRHWKINFAATFTFTGHCARYEYSYISEGNYAWVLRGESDETRTEYFGARYRRRLTWPRPENLDPTGAYDYYYTWVYGGTSPIFDIKRNDIISVVGKTY